MFDTLASIQPRLCQQSVWWTDHSISLHSSDLDAMHLDSNLTTLKDEMHNIIRGDLDKKISQNCVWLFRPPPQFYFCNMYVEYQTGY